MLDWESLSIAKRIFGFFFKIDLVKLPGPGPTSMIVCLIGSDFLTILSVTFISNRKLYMP